MEFFYLEFYAEFIYGNFPNENTNGLALWHLWHVVASDMEGEPLLSCEVNKAGNMRIAPRLFLVPVLLGNIVLGHLTRAYFALVRVVSLLNPGNGARLKQVPFFNQLFDAFGVGLFGSGYSLQVSCLFAQLGLVSDPVAASNIPLDFTLGISERRFAARFVFWRCLFYRGFLNGRFTAALAFSGSLVALGFTFVFVLCGCGFGFR
jgi:hypothetical protein